MLLFSLLVGLVPVLLFLAALMFMDSYKLVPRRAVLSTLAAGALAALAALAVNRLLLGSLDVEPVLVRRYWGPLVEEALKALYIVLLLRAGRVGFMVDAGIAGFAVGTGFALVENVYVAHGLRDFQPLLWVVRGLGTAVMHGSTTALLAILSKDLTDRRDSRAAWLFLPGLALAFAAHSAFNHLAPLSLFTTALQLVLMPLLFVLVFERSEQHTRDWLGFGMDADVEVLELLLSDEFPATRAGRYLGSLRERFEGPVMADLFCLLRLHLELSLKAKGLLLARAAGVEMPADEHVRAGLEEMRFLERSVGKTGQMALMPLVKQSSRDLWQLYMLGK